MESSKVMNHQEAENTKATERYLLREMTDQERQAFEEHYLDCPECLESVTFGADFLAAGKEVAQESVANQRILQVADVQRRSWLAFLKPVWQPVPVMALALAVCVGFAGYEALLLQQIKSGNNEKAASVDYRYILTGMAHGSGDAKKILVPKGAIVSVGVEYNPSGEFVTYRAQVVDDAGRTKISIDLPADQTGRMASIALHTQLLAPGLYSTIISGRRSDGAEEQVGKGSFELVYK
jgi:hypothetical protein